MMTRIQLELPEEKVRQLEALMSSVGLKTKKDLISNALTLLVWAIKERGQGNIIASVNERDKKYKEILLPALENVQVVSVQHRDEVASASKAD